MTRTFQSQVETMQAISTGLDVSPTIAWAAIENAMVFQTQSFPYPGGHASLRFNSDGSFTISADKEF